ncbi:hypothetical protein EV356DRAFT_19091 [Viridothelium virens]|uniref:Mtf2-like C-terminal domain-containing protein n=1 Tax=Viridothelium virens TaxID=1048519 RepID=A0A6A6GUF4_VIRVR|nr:hypothetical protein EV356DRAFT_19091 [Viridothelium virens]
MSPAKPLRSATTLLPFLYYTRTIHRGFYISPLSIIPSSSSSNRHRRNSRRLWSGKALQEPRSVSFSRSPKRLSRDSDYVPFEVPEDLRKTSPKESSERSVKSTLTDEEEKIFARLLADTQKRAAENDDIQELRRTSLKAIHSEREDQSGADSITEILQGALEATSKERLASTDKKEANISTTMPPPLRTLLKAKRASIERDRPTSTAHQDERIINRAQDMEFARVDKLLASAKTDVELWNILEKHVFARIQTLQTSVSPSSTSDSAASSRAHKERIKSTATHAATLHPTELTRQSARNPAPTPTSSSKPAPHQAHRDAALALLGPNYSAWLVRALRLLRHDFPSSTLAFSLLPRVKALGVASYALGASTMLYNELVSLHWTGFGDLEGVDALLREMEVGGLDFDAGTLEVLDAIVGVERRKRRGGEGRVMWLVARMDGEDRRAGKMLEWRKVVRERLEQDALMRGGGGEGCDEGEG